MFFPARPEIDLPVVVLSRIFFCNHRNNSRIQRWRNRQGFLSLGHGFRLKPMPIRLLISSLATYTLLLHSRSMYFAADVNIRMHLQWHCWGPAIFLSLVAAATGHLQWQHVERIGTSLKGKGRGRESQIQPGERKGKQSKRQGILGNWKHLT